MIHPDDAARLGIADGAEVVIGNTRGQVRLHARVFDGVRRGVLIAELIWPNDAYPDGKRHQHADRRGLDRALWRRGVPRQQGLDQAGSRLIAAKCGDVRPLTTTSGIQRRPCRCAR